MELMRETTTPPNMQERPTANLGQMAFPTEIMLDITASLDIVSQICLRLTCRTMYFKYCPCRKAPCYSDFSKRKLYRLLSLLERDLPSLYACVECVKLHAWNGLSLTCSHTGSAQSQSSLNCRPDHELRFRKRLYLPYYLARGVMTRHLQGDLYGFPLTDLEFSTDYVDELDASFKQTVSARIIDDQLFLMSDTTVSRRERRICWKSLRAMRIQLCSHLSTNKLNHRLPPANRAAGSCKRCMTDYCIRFDGDKKDAALQIKVYQKVLGRRKKHQVMEPQDWYWASLEGKSSDLDGRRGKYEPVYGLGIVRRMWQSVDGVEPDSDGEWVDTLAKLSRWWTDGKWNLPSSPAN